jgi:hypothetical protein
MPASLGWLLLIWGTAMMVYQIYRMASGGVSGFTGWLFSGMSLAVSLVMIYFGYSAAFAAAPAFPVAAATTGGRRRRR